MFKYAGDQEIVATNYASPVELPTKEDSDLHKPFTREEPDKFWRHTEDLGARVALILCYTGLRPTELAKIKTADVDLPERCMKGGIKTKAGKNRLIPGAEKIFPPVEGFYMPANKFLLTVDGAPLSNAQNLRKQIWDKSPLLANHFRTTDATHAPRSRTTPKSL